MSSRIICSVICRRKRACGRIIRCVRSGHGGRSSHSNSRGGLTGYTQVGRPSIAPEKLLRAQLLQMLYSIRSERLLMEEMDYNLLFRWFVGLNADDEVWDATTFTKNRDRRWRPTWPRSFWRAWSSKRGRRG